MIHLRGNDSIPEKVQVYFIELEQYDYTLFHRSGHKHGNADALSRIPEVKDETVQHDESCQSIRLQLPIWMEWIIHYS